MPPVLVFAIGAMGAVMLVRWCVKEAQRVNAELDNIRGRAAAPDPNRDGLPKLKRDPKTGEYRPS